MERDDGDNALLFIAIFRHVLGKSEELALLGLMV
jgi:hypothetical protein